MANFPSPGLKVFHFLREEKRVACDDVAQTRVVHADAFEEEQPRSHIRMEVKTEQHGADVGPLLQLPQVHPCQ